MYTTTIHNSVMPIQPVTVPHGGVEMFHFSPDFTFRPYRFIVDPICAPFYMIEELLFGNQIMIDRPISAVCFPPLPPDFKKLTEEEQAAISSYLNKITFPTITPTQSLRMAIRHRGMCPWHSDCNQVAGLDSACKAPPFSCYFQGMGSY